MESQPVNDRIVARRGLRGPAPAGRANIRDVARLAGVSSATVSRVLSGRTSVGAVTKAKVEAAADALGYVVNGPARAMMGIGSTTIALLVREMVGPSFAEIAAGAESVATENDGLFLLCTTHGEESRERRLIESFRQQRVSGIVMVGSTPASVEFAARLREYARDAHGVDAHFVVCGRPPVTGAPEIGSVDYAHAEGVRLVTRHLLDAGHRDLVFLGADEGFTTPVARLSGFRSAIAEQDSGAVRAVARPADNLPESGEAAVLALLDEGIPMTAIVCSTDAIAVGAYRALRSRGLRIPDDVSVTGFDDSPWSRDLTPALTTVGVAFRQMGMRAARMALGLDAVGTETVPIELVVRESTAVRR